MKITESQLRRIVREELNEMRKSGITLRFNPETGEYEESGMEDFPGAGAEMARAVGSARAGGATASAHVKQDIYEKLSKHGGITERGILMSLSTKYRPAQIEAALSDMMRRGDIDQDDRGVYHIAGYEEYAEDPYEGAAFSKEEIQDIQQGMYGKRR